MQSQYLMEVFQDIYQAGFNHAELSPRLLCKKSNLKFKKAQSFKKVTFGQDQVIFQYNKNSTTTEINSQAEPLKPTETILEIIQQASITPIIKVDQVSKQQCLTPSKQLLPLEYKKNIKIKSFCFNSENMCGKKRNLNQRQFTQRKVILNQKCIICQHENSNIRLACAHTAHSKCFYMLKEFLCKICESKNLLR